MATMLQCRSPSLSPSPLTARKHPQPPARVAPFLLPSRPHLRLRAEVEASPVPEPSAAAAGEKAKRPSPLEKGGTLSGKEAAGKDPAASTLAAEKRALSFSGKFSDPRWVNGTWAVEKFAKDGKVDWDAVIDAEVVRRQWLEENPQSSSNDDKVLFDTSTIPWWAWVRRFHLPEAEKLNGRAAMVGFVLGYVVDAATGVGLVDQTDAFLGKFLLLVTVVGVLLIRRNEDVATIKGLVEESTFYDRQWQATWKEGPPPATTSEEK